MPVRPQSLKPFIRRVSVQGATDLDGTPPSGPQLQTLSPENSINALKPTYQSQDTSTPR